MTREQTEAVATVIEKMEAARTARADAIKRMSEAIENAVRGARDEVLDALKEVLLLGLTVPEIVERSGRPRSTVYRWASQLREREPELFEPRKELEQAPPEPAAPEREAAPEPEVAWDVQRTLPETGEVIATAPNGDLWVLGPGTTAWNRTTNELLEEVTEWPAGAEDAFDRAKQKSEE